MTELSRATAKLAHIRRMVHGPGPSGASRPPTRPTRPTTWTILSKRRASAARSRTSPTKRRECMSDFRPMLAAKADPDKISYPVLAQPKLDGIRAAVVGGMLLSRTLKPIPNREIQAALAGRRVRPGSTARSSSATRLAPRRLPAHGQLRHGTRQDGRAVGVPTPSTFTTTRGRTSRGARLAQIIERYDHTGLPVFTVPTRMIAERRRAIRPRGRPPGRGPRGRHPARPGRALQVRPRHGQPGQLLKVKRFSDSEAVVVGYAEEEHNANEGFTNELGRTARSTAKAGLVGLTDRKGGQARKADRARPLHRRGVRVRSGFRTRQNAKRCGPTPRRESAHDPLPLLRHRREGPPAASGVRWVPRGVQTCRSRHSDPSLPSDPTQASVPT